MEVLRHSKVHGKSGSHRQTEFSANRGQELQPPLILIKYSNAVLFENVLAFTLRQVVLDQADFRAQAK